VTNRRFLGFFGVSWKRIVIVAIPLLEVSHRPSFSRPLTVHECPRS
jgi:hypothetical protein